jgi:phosphoribosylglycinamide formyltransferase-1
VKGKRQLFLNNHKPLPIAILASGQGTNLQAIIDAIEKGTLNAQIAVVISDNPKAFALERAKKHGIPHQVFVRKNYPDQESYEADILKALQEKKVEWIALAGYMRLLSSKFVAAYRNRILNIHPALLPSFPGLDAVSQTLQYGAKVTGCTVHLVDEGCDTGPIVAQRVVEIGPENTVETLTEKIHHEEHRLYPEVLQWAAEGRIKIEGRKVLIK